MLKIKVGTLEQIEQRSQKTAQKVIVVDATEMPDSGLSTQGSNYAQSSQGEPPLDETQPMNWIGRLYQRIKSFFSRSKSLEPEATAISTTVGVDQAVSTAVDITAGKLSATDRGARSLVTRSPTFHPTPSRPPLGRPSSPAPTPTPASLILPRNETRSAPPRVSTSRDVPKSTQQTSPIPSVESSRQRRIKQFCQERGITRLMHFTRLENLDTILGSGLVPRNQLPIYGINSAVFNDTERHDGHMNAVCLSISFPNYKNFYRWKQQYNVPWIVIGIHARVLWEVDCAFCASNASSTSVRNIPVSTRKQPRSLETLFDDFQDKGYVVHRAELPIPRNFPTNPQAEVLAFGVISPSYIQTIYFETAAHLNQYSFRPTHSAWKAKMKQDASCFSYRSDYRFWQRAR